MALSDEAERLVDELRTRLPGAIDDAIKRALFLTSKEFLDFTNVWTEDVDFNTAAGDKTYTIAPSLAYSKITRLLQVLNENDTPIAAMMTIPGDILLRYEPNTVETLTATIALTTNDPNDADDMPQFPAWILVKYSETLMDGVLGRMMSQPAKPYANERMAIYHMRRFRSGMVVAKTEGRHGHLFGAQNWQFPRFA